MTQHCRKELKRLPKWALMKVVCFNSSGCWKIYQTFLCGPVFLLWMKSKKVSYLFANWFHLVLFLSRISTLILFNWVTFTLLFGLSCYQNITEFLENGLLLCGNWERFLVISRNHALQRRKILEHVKIGDAALLKSKKFTRMGIIFAS